MCLPLTAKAELKPAPEGSDLKDGLVASLDFAGTIDGVPFAGPAIVSVQRQKASKIVAVDTAGCAKQTVLENTVDPKFFVNILGGGAFGSTTDYSTEKMWKYADNVVVSCGQ